MTLNDTLSRVFYDSLKVRAERRKITSLLYDMIIVNPAHPGSAREKLRNTSSFDPYVGRVIRRKEIIRLNAFGTNIDNPSENDPSRTEKLLNSSYTKTKRLILSKYLLFREGDTISPLSLADNERLLRELPFIDDARITIMPVDSNLVDVAIIVREKYPYGAEVRIDDVKSGMIRAYDRNFAGLAHELSLAMPYDFNKYKYPGFGIKYSIRNIARSFSDLDLEFNDGLGTTIIGGIYSREFVTSETKYAWSATVRMTLTSEDLDTMLLPVPLRFTWNDYWAARSFMLERNSVTRLIISGRYMHNNVFRRPVIDDFSYYRLQNYKLVTGSLALSSQRFINTSLIYSYGRTEDIPYGYMVEMLGGREKNEFKWRTYAGLKVSYGNIFTRFGYIYGGAALSTFYNLGNTEQGMLNASLRYFTPLIPAGRSKMRTFVNAYYTRGFNRYTDESLYLRNNTLVRGFRNDSISGGTRLAFSLEPVLLINKAALGFRFAVFAFADYGLLVREGLFDGGYYSVAALGAGIRIRNDQLVMNTLQIRFAWYPNAPPYSHKSWIAADGILRLKPPDFLPDPPGVTPFY
ncbi:MAG: hypothetical protein IH592_04740 [Bacteroidales bacterium]|nr:hypothetical protein [Bacteroidales bacterium]